MTNLPLMISAFCALISAFSVLFTWLNYRISRKMPNENKLFEEKFKSYRSVIAALNSSAGVYIECANAFQDLKPAAQKQSKDKDDLDDEMTKAYFLMEDTIYEQSLLLPDEVLECVYDYFDLFKQEDFLSETVKAGKTEAFEDQLNEKFDEVINAMREDLAFDKLDNSLKKRIGSRHRANHKEVFENQEN